MKPKGIGRDCNYGEVTRWEGICGGAVCATSRKGAGCIPDGVTKIFH